MNHLKFLSFFLNSKLGFSIVFLFFALIAEAKTIKGYVTNADNEAMSYATVKVKHKNIATLTDSIGNFKLNSDKISNSDTLSVSYLGYETLEFLSSEDVDTIVLHEHEYDLPVFSVTVPRKIKHKTMGKTHEWALVKSMMNGDMRGESFGYEFHAKKGKSLVLSKVGFYYCDGDKQMTSMKFRVNVYDMSEVKSAPSSAFKNVLSSPIFFDFKLADQTENKFEYALPESIILPKDAMVEIEFLEDLGDEIFWFKSNLLGKSTWSKLLAEDEWDKNPFATPFFVDCYEIDSTCD